MKNNLVKLRLAKNLTQERLCMELQKYGCYISRSTYSKYETGERNVSCENLCLFAKYFETTTDAILGIKQHEECQKRKGFKR